VPEQFGSYTIHEQLGAGGMATVHLADGKFGGTYRRRVALKRLFPEIAASPEIVAMFIDEARLARYLKHPNIAQVYEFGRVSGVYFIAFEFVPGPTVDQLWHQCKAHVGFMPVPVVMNIASQLCDALEHAHTIRNESGMHLAVVHRDVSPQNLILSNTGFVKLIDFGLAKAKHSSVQSQAGIIKGKLSYVAPEYLAGRLDARCDLWAVGILLHELLTGRRLFDAGDGFATLDRVRSMQIPPPSWHNPEVTSELDQIVLKALQRDPDHRWQTAAEIRAALAKYGTTRQELTRQQLVHWVEWAFAQKQPLREDSGVSKLHELIESGVVEEVDEASLEIKLPATSAAMLERRRESVLSMPAVGAAMLHRRGAPPMWVWLAVGVVAILAVVVLLMVRA
jgi:serine/threonine protein kinase